MAGIDKTYVHSYKEWRDYIDWARKTVFTCPNGIKLYPINFCCYTEEDDKYVKELFDKYEDYEMTLMNTPCDLDYFLIKYCPLEFIQKSMREWSYCEENYNKIKNGESEYDKFVRPEGGKHFKWVKKPKYSHTLKFRANNGKVRRSTYFIDAEFPEEHGGYGGYNWDYDMWVLPGELGYYNCSGADACHSLKSLIRKLKKWNLPVGTKLRVFNGEYGEVSQCIVCK